MSYINSFELPGFDLILRMKFLKFTAQGVTLWPVLRGLMKVIEDFLFNFLRWVFAVNPFMCIFGRDVVEILNHLKNYQNNT